MTTFKQHFEDGQPAACPLEYFSVTKSGDELRVDAKARGSSAPEVPRVFKGPNRFAEYDRFWRFMETNMNNFSQCANPLIADPDYLSAKQMNDQTTTNGNNMNQVNPFTPNNNNMNQVNPFSPGNNNMNQVNPFSPNGGNNNMNQVNPFTPNNNNNNMNQVNPFTPNNNNMNQVNPFSPNNNNMNQVNPFSPNNNNNMNQVNPFSPDTNNNMNQVNPFSPGNNQVIIDQPFGCPFKRSIVTRQGDVITLTNDAADPMMLDNSKYQQFWSDPLNQLCIDPMTQAPTPNQPSNPDTIDIDNIFDNNTYVQPQTPEINWNTDTNDYTVSISWSSRIIRLLILFGLVYLFTTIIPQTPLDDITKLIIAATVVIFYALLDVLRAVLKSFKNYTCAKVCGCSS